MVVVEGVGSPKEEVEARGGREEERGREEEGEVSRVAELEGEIWYGKRMRCIHMDMSMLYSGECRSCRERR